MKPYFRPVKVYRQIEALQENPDYRFDEVPMPYDLTLNAKAAGTKEVVYTILPARANVALTAAELDLVAKAGTVAEFQQALPGQGTAAPVDGPGFQDLISVDDATPVDSRHATVPPEFRPRA